MHGVRSIFDYAVHNLRHSSLQPERGYHFLKNGFEAG
jgi:hypothetical protein